MKRVVALGDSVLLGIIRDDGNYKISKQSFARICEEQLDISVKNYSRMGATVSKGYELLQKHKADILNYGAEYVVCEFGGNDCDFIWDDISKSPSDYHYPRNLIKEFHKQYSELIRDIRLMEIEPILLSLPPICSSNYIETLSEKYNREGMMSWLEEDKNFLNSWHEMYNLEVFKIARECDAELIDISSPILKKKNYCKYICSDGIHPNECGHRIIANEIISYSNNHAL